MKLRFAELHAPLFHAGKNFGLKLEPSKVTGLEMNYDYEKNRLLVTYMGRTAILPSTSVHSFEEGEADAPTKPATVEAIPHKKIKAQVSGPTDHVFQGEGAGLKRDKR